MYVTADRSHAAWRRDMHKEFSWVNLNRRDSLEDIITNLLLIIKGIELLTENWAHLKTGTTCEFMWKVQWTFELYIIRKISLSDAEIIKGKSKVKQFLYSPGQTLSVPVSWGSQISRQSAHEGGKFVSPTHRPPLPRRKYFWNAFLLEDESP